MSNGMRNKVIDSGIGNNANEVLREFDRPVVTGALKHRRGFNFQIGVCSNPHLGLRVFGND